MFAVYLAFTIASCVLVLPILALYFLLWLYVRIVANRRAAERRIRDRNVFDRYRAQRGIPSNDQEFRRYMRMVSRVQ